MAIVVEADSANLEDAESYTTIDNSDTLLLLSLFSDDADDGTLDEHDLGGTSVSASGSLLVGTSTAPYGKGAYSYYLNSVAPTGDNDFNVAISTTFANQGGYVVELSGVDQSTTVIKHEVLFPNTGGTSFDTHTVTMAAGDIVFLICTCATAQTTVAPPDLGTVDAFTTAINNEAGLIGGGADGGSVYYAIATQTHTDVDIIIGLSASSSIRLSQCVVVQAAVGGGGGISIPIVGYHHRRRN